MKHGITRFCLTAGLPLILAACGNENSETALSSDGVEDRSSETFAQVLSEEPSFSIATGALEGTGLIGVLDGEASYTIFIPTNEAFEALGDQGDQLRADMQDSAIAAAVLRNHMVPGILDIEAIDEAIADAGGEAAVANFGGGVLTLTREEGGLFVSDASGRKAAISDRVSIVGNGAFMGIDGVLVDPAVSPIP